VFNRNTAMSWGLLNPPDPNSSCVRACPDSSWTVGSTTPSRFWSMTGSRVNRTLVRPTSSSPTKQWLAESTTSESISVPVQSCTRNESPVSGSVTVATKAPT
jgi:hypothetical protein